MQRHWSVIVLTLAVYACDRPMTTAAATGPDPSHDAPMNERSNVPIPPPDGGFIPFGEMDPQDAERMRSLLAAAELMQVPPAVGARRERERLDPVRFAVSDGPLPGGAIAAVVRAPRSNPGRLIVISREATDDRALFLADAALDHDEEADPEPLRRRITFVNSDGRVDGAGIRSVALKVTVPPSAGRHFITTLLQAAETGSLLQVPDVGAVRIATF